MIKIHAAIVGFVLSITPLMSFAHGDAAEGPVALEVSSPAPTGAGKSTLTFQMIDTAQNKLISESDLSLSHEAKLHMMIYDPSLKEFQHVHPQMTSAGNATWNVEVNFQVNGNYWVWVQGELASSGESFSASNRMLVTGAKPAWPETALLDLRSGEDSNSIVTLGSTTLRAGKMAMLNMVFSHKDGTSPVITPYLGAVAHVVATSSDGDVLIHVHPMAGSSANVGMLHVSFQEAGFYRLWIQFIDNGVLKTVPLSLEVK